MPRAKRGNKRTEKRKKILSRAKGFRGTKSKLYRSAKESVERALNFAYTGRKLKKRDFRRLWIVRINAACRLNEMKYSQFMNGLKLAGVELDRKVLADLAVKQPETFATLVGQAKDAITSNQKQATA
jgi:large subunit ribosomal protein L20